MSDIPHNNIPNFFSSTENNQSNPEMDCQEEFNENHARLCVCDTYNHTFEKPPPAQI